MDQNLFTPENSAPQGPSDTSPTASGRVYRARGRAGSPQEEAASAPAFGYSPAPEGGFPGTPPPYPPSGDGFVPYASGSVWNVGEPLDAPAAKKPLDRHTPLQIALLAVGTALLLLVAMVLGALLLVGGQLGSLTRVGRRNTVPPSGTFSVIQMVGTLQSMGSDALGVNDPSYHHAETVDHIKALAENDGNTGILLYMNTPGGGVYESDEVYLALKAYKEATKRPIWVYMADTCASGGYYVAMSSDHIVANRNTITGSIGVYVALTDLSGLYEKLGMESVLIRSGPNKGVGTLGTPITPEQRAVYQSIVDEDYAAFVDIVAEGRNMNQTQVQTLGDGRIYSGRQALDNGLVDELGDWDTTLAAFQETTASKPFYADFSHSTTLGRIIGSFTAQLPQNEIETQLALAEKYPVGVPMALYQPA